MFKILTLLLLCYVAPAQAGLFADDEAHRLIHLLEARADKLEVASKQLESANKQLEKITEQQVKAMLDLQGQIETLNADLRKLRGQNEELTHNLQDGEKRVKDFYVDLDARVRHFESTEEAVKVATIAIPVVSTDPSDPALQNRAFESAYALSKAGNHENTAKAFQEFLKKYPDSVYVPNAKFGLGNAQFALRDYKTALETFQELLGSAPGFAKAAEVMFSVAGCQQELNQNAAAKKTLKQLVVKYPSSEAATKANQLLAATK